MAKSVFYSFHYDRDVHRVQLVRNINALEGQPVLNAQEWEKVRQGGQASIKEWIDKLNDFVKNVYLIEKAWADKKPLLGIRIHGLSSLGTVDSAGPSPFDQASVGTVPVFDPTVIDWAGKIDSKATYNTLRNRIESWSTQGAVKSLW